MTVQLASITQWLRHKGIDYKEDNGEAWTRIEIAKSEKGTLDAALVFACPLDGRVLSVKATDFVPAELVAKLAQDPAFLINLLQIGTNTPFGAVELDAKKGMLSFVVEVPLEDNVVTAKQFDTIVQSSLSGAGLVLQLIGKMAEEGGDSPSDEVQQAVAALVDEGSSQELRERALGFLVQVAQDEARPTVDRMLAHKALAALKEAMEKAKRAEAPRNIWSR